MNILMTVIVSLVVVAVLGLIVTSFGQVEGEEFSPDDFTRRTFYYCEIPLIQLQVFPIVREDNTGALENHLIGKKLITPVKNEKPIWHLVRNHRAAGSSQFGDAEILCAYFDMDDESGKPFWLSWSNEHPELAKVVWPVVARLARQQLYVFVPDLMSLTKAAQNADALERTVNGFLVDKYVEMAKLHQQNDEHDIAVDILSAALESHSKSAELYETRATSYTALDKTGQAAEDRLRAKELGE